MGRVTHRIRVLGSDRRASAAVEFTLIGSICISLVMETMQFGLYLYYSASLERAMTKASRQIMTGAVQSKGMTADGFRQTVLCPLLPSVMPCTNVITNLRTVPEDVAPNGFYAFLNASKTGIAPPAVMDNTKTAFCVGSSGSTVYAQSYYAMPLISPIWRAAIGQAWQGSTVSFLTSGAAFRNEPFSSLVSSAC